MMPQDMFKKDSARLCNHFWLGWKRIVTRIPANVWNLGVVTCGGGVAGDFARFLKVAMGK